MRQKFRNDLIFYMHHALKIRTKNGRMEALKINESQRFLHNIIEQQKRDIGVVRAIVLKGRQQGISTYTEGRFFHNTTMNRGRVTYILAHELAASTKIFNMSKLFYENLPEFIKPSIRKNNSKVLDFGGLTSDYTIGTSENKSTGRSGTTHNFHASEVGFWANSYEHASGVMETVPNAAGTEVILESTANGMNNLFYDIWELAKRGENEFIPVFLSWTLQQEYRHKVPKDFILKPEEHELMQEYGLDLEQIVWRRMKIGKFGSDGLYRFKRDYPLNDIEAFQSSNENALIIPSIVMKARENKANLTGWEDLIVGVDPARFGDDNTAIVLRRGNKCEKIQTYSKLSITQIAEKCEEILRDNDVKSMNIDEGGVGAGVVDILHKTNYKRLINGVNFGSSAIKKDEYVNRRAEMWWLMREWLETGEVDIPDSNSLHADLTAPTYKYDQKGRRVLESKDSIKKRLKHSPDEGDALALTFDESLNKKAVFSGAGRKMGGHRMYK